MIELPEAVTLARQLREGLVGARVAAVTAAHSPHAFAWYHGDPSEYPRLLEGRTVDDASSHGGFVELALGDARLLFSEGATMRLLDPDARRPPKHQLLVEFDDGRALIASIQMYGGLWAYPEGGFEDPYDAAARQAPSPLGERFDDAHFERLLAAPGTERCSLKAFLATEQRVPGLGNGVLQDILYDARMHPKRRVESLDGDERATLLRSLTATLRAMADGGGRDTERDLFGEPGRYATRCSRFTVGTACGRCGSTLEKAQYLGGAVYTCPGCQPLA